MPSLAWSLAHTALATIAMTAAASRQARSSPHNNPWTMSGGSCTRNFSLGNGGGGAGSATTSAGSWLYVLQCTTHSYNHLINESYSYWAEHMQVLGGFDGHRLWYVRVVRAVGQCSQCSWWVTSLL